MFQRFENFVADTAEALFEETDSDSDDNSIHDHSHERMQTPDKSLNTTIATAKTLSTPTLQLSTSISTKHTTNNAIHTTIDSKVSTRTPTKTPTTTTSIFPNKTTSSPPSAILSPIRNNPTKTFTSTATSLTTNVTNINHHTNSTIPSRSTRTHFQRSNRNDNYHNKTATTTTPTSTPPQQSNDTTVADTTIALLQTDLRQSQQEVQNLRSVLHTFSANADEARVDGQNSLNLQSNKHAHALQLLTTEMVAAKERAQAAETREKQVTGRLNATIEALQQELQEKEHLLRLAKSRADEIENQEMVDRRLVRKVLLQYVGGGGGGGGGTGRMQQPRRVSNEDPVDLLAVILGLDEKQRNALSNGKRRRDMGDSNSGLSAMGSFLSDLTGL